jgi:hypothetical protein
MIGVSRLRSRERGASVLTPELINSSTMRSLGSRFGHTMA